MERWKLAGVLALLGATIGRAAPLDDLYHLGPDSAPREGVPRGVVRGPSALPSRAFPGTQHTYWVYVPAQYEPGKPASLMVFMDGHAFLKLEGDYRMPFVLDNLIYRREIPVMLAVFINPGRRPDQPEPEASNWGDRTTNRPEEYNSLDDRFARVLIEELLPELSKDYNISTRPEDRGLAGASSGAICAFNAAWHRPDQFRKVISIIGSFTNLRGGHVYPELILKEEPKPIRIFIQDGVNDHRNLGKDGVYDPKMDWHAQNRKMVEALTAKRYDLNYTFGIGTHSNRQAGAIMPEMLRWLWRDYPRADDPLDDRERKPLPPVTRPAE